MGIKSFFKTKPKTQDEFENSITDKMEDKNLPTKRTALRQKEKQFGEFGQYAQQYGEKIQKKKYSPFAKDELESTTDDDPSTSSSSNPYAVSGGSNPYGNLNSASSESNPYGTSKPEYNQGSSNPYAANTPTPYARKSAAATKESSRSNPYQQVQSQSQPQYQEQLQRQPTQELDLNDDGYRDDETNYDDLNNDAYHVQSQAYQEPEPIHEETEEERLQREEDEEVIQVKDEIREEKIKTIGSLRNTLQMARDAETSGKNTVGMLGSQSEALMDIEANLSLAEKQQKISKEKINELHHYNRSMFKPSMKNPFTKSRRLRLQEENIKNEHLQSKLEREQQRVEMSQSANRVNNTLNHNESAIHDSVTDKYRREKYRTEAKQYQFENDSEDDEMEMEIAENLDEVAKVSGRLKKLAMTQSEEIDRQNYRMRDIEEKTDKLDINVHLNTASLSRAR
jgi:hypothetical protein